jgi:hypothetical protein
VEGSGVGFEITSFALASSKPVKRSFRIDRNDIERMIMIGMDLVGTDASPDEMARYAKLAFETYVSNVLEPAAALQDQEKI